MKTIGIEALLRWAYCEELPKAGAPARLIAASAPQPPRVAHDAVAEQGRCGFETVDDGRVNQYGVLELDRWWAEEHGPHDDAVAVAAAMAEVDRWAGVFPDGWDPLSDLRAADASMARELDAAVVRGLDRLTVTGADGVRRLRDAPSRVVVRQAVLGRAPDWQAELPEKVEVRHPTTGKAMWFVRTTVWAGALTADGQPAEVGRYVEVEQDGWNHRRGHPHAGAYRKHLLEPDPVGIVLDRGAWEVWRAALEALVEALEGRLASVRLAPIGLPQRPWEDGEAAGPRVLLDLRRPVDDGRVTRAMGRRRG